MLKTVHFHRMLICGDRNWGNPEPIREVIALRQRVYGLKLIVIEGGAPGADTFARIACKALSVHWAEVPALWDTRHKGSGPQRNTAMLGLAPHEVLGFHNDIKNSKGTKNMLTQAYKHDFDVQLYSDGEWRVWEPS